MAHGSIRLRLTFDRDLTGAALHNFPRHVMYQPHFLPPNIGGLASLVTSLELCRQIQDDFRIDAPESLALSVDIWRLPPRSSTALLRDNNSVKVARSTGPELSLREDHGRGTMTQPASMGPAPANPSSAFVSASSGPAASQPSMPAVSLPPAAAPAFETEHDEESMDPAELDAARANYDQVMQRLQGKPDTVDTPLLQPGEASGPAASQPSMPAVSLPPAAAPAFEPEHDEDTVEIPDAEIDAARGISEKVMQHFPGKPDTVDTHLLQPGEASGPAASQPSMPAVSLPPAAAPAFGPVHDEESVEPAEVAAARVIYQKFMRRL